jgi:cytidylate kinase
MIVQPSIAESIQARRNVLISGLTAAGKTTHARLLAAELSYRYVSATEIIADMIGIDKNEASAGFWQRYGLAVGRIRDTTDLDRELDARLIKMATADEALVIDAWALPWLITSSHCISLWIESDHRSRTLKASVSDDNRRQLEWYEEFISRKDNDSRRRFLLIYGFDLYGSRSQFDVELNNSDYITQATRKDSDRGIARFQPALSYEVRKHLAPARENGHAY